MNQNPVTVSRNATDDKDRPVHIHAVSGPFNSDDPASNEVTYTVTRKGKLDRTLVIQHADLLRPDGTYSPTDSSRVEADLSKNDIAKLGKLIGNQNATTMMTLFATEYRNRYGRLIED